tara:strand:+ start:11972 stop:12556 length:585 start_codon:yes stop_codon:yes gene_type:complete
MAQEQKNPNQIILLLLLAGGGYYLWNENKKKQQMMMARQGGGEEEASGGAGGGFGGGAGGGGFSTPIIQSGGEGTEINVEVSNPTPSTIDCIKFPNTAGCNNTTQQAVQEPVRGVATGGGGLSTGGGGLSTGGGGVATGGANPRGNTSPVATQPKTNFIDFDGDFDYLEGRSKGRSMDFRMKDSWAKTDFDGEL